MISESQRAEEGENGERQFSEVEEQQRFFEFTPLQSATADSIHVS